MLTEDDIVAITRRILASCAPLAVGIFGSYAIGAASESSDLDLFVIKAGTGSCATTRHFRCLLSDVLHPLDLHVFTAEQFEASAYRRFSFTWVLARHARIYHWTEAAERLIPSLVGAPRADSIARLPAVDGPVRVVDILFSAPRAERDI